MEIRKLINWMRSPWVWRLYYDMPYEGGYIFAQYYPDNLEQAAEHLLTYALENRKEPDEPTIIRVVMEYEKGEDSKENVRAYHLDIEGIEEEQEIELSETNKRILRLLIQDMKNPNFSLAEYDDYSSLSLYKYNLYLDVK